METKGFMPMNLQLFGGAAEGAAPEDEAGRGQGAEKGLKERATDSTGAVKERAESSKGPSLNKRAEGPEGSELNALLAGDRGLQSQFDKLVSKALTTAQAKWEKERSMTAEQLAEARAQEMAQELAQREQALRGKELRVEALALFGEKGVPAELIDCVSLADEEAMRASAAKAERAFRAAVERAVRERMTGTVPKSGKDAAGAYLAQFRAAAGVKTK